MGRNRWMRVGLVSDQSNLGVASVRLATRWQDPSRIGLFRPCVALGHFNRGSKSGYLIWKVTMGIASSFSPDGELLAVTRENEVVLLESSLKPNSRAS